MQLRDYQDESVKAFLDWMKRGLDKPLIVLPTGTGKSVVAASICKRVLESNPRARIVVATHVKELVKQNHDKMLAVWPEAPVGILSAGLKRKDYDAQLLFCGIQSSYKRVDDIGHVDLLLIDECHAIPRSGMGMWNRFTEGLTLINPKLRIGGLTATPFRMSTGMLHLGDAPQFNGICYEYNIKDAISSGYLSNVVTPKSDISQISTKGIKKVAGDFSKGALEKAASDLTQECVSEIVNLGRDRRSWLIFASGNNHAQQIHDLLAKAGYLGYCVTQRTPPAQRDEAVRSFSSGECRYIVNNMILTTGFDCPRIDLVACLRPTKSPGLWVQMCGRGLRLFDKKKDCLLLDFGRNIDRHGPVDLISGSIWFEKEKGDAPIKVCSSCRAVIYASARSCPECDYIFPGSGGEDFDNAASQQNVFSFQKNKTEVFDVVETSVKTKPHKDGAGFFAIVTYYTLSGKINDFFFFDKSPLSRPYKESAQKIGAFSSTSQFVDAIKSGKVRKAKKVYAIKDGKYYKVTKVTYQ